MGLAAEAGFLLTQRPATKKKVKNGGSATSRQAAALAKLKVNELQAKFAEVTGETTRSANKTFLIRRITEALQPAEAAVEAFTANEPGGEMPVLEAESDTPARGCAHARKAHQARRGNPASPLPRGGRPPHGLGQQGLPT